MAMFPPAMPHVFIRWLTEPGDVVYDPFSGRGTTAFEACLLGRKGYGSDANPLAVLLTGAKVAPPTRRELNRRLDQLDRNLGALPIDDEPEHVRMLFSPRTLGELKWLREELDSRRTTDRFLLAALAGIMHGNLNTDGSPSGLTVPMPNTFSMSPGYVAKYISTHRLATPELPVLAFLRKRSEFLPLPNGDFTRGRAWTHDATASPVGPVVRHAAKLIFTSPPYLRVIKYGQYNWIRLWLLKETPSRTDSRLFTSESVNRYTRFMLKSVSALRPILRDDGYLCLVIGDVAKESGEVNLAQRLADEMAPATDLAVLGEISDRLPVANKVSRIWGETRGRATRTDRILILGGPAALAFPGLEPIRWG